MESKNSAEYLDFSLEADFDGDAKNKLFAIFLCLCYNGIRRTIMTAQKRKNNKKWLWWGAGILILAVVIGGGVLIWRKNDADDKKTEETAVVEKSEKTDPTEIEPETEPVETMSTGVEKEKVVQYEGEDPNTETGLSGVVTYAGVSGEKLMVRVSIDQYLTSGTCELSLKKDGVVIYSDTAGIVGSASTSTCEGFDILTSSLGANGATGAGKIEININISADGRSGAISGEVEI